MVKVERGGCQILLVNILGKIALFAVLYTELLHPRTCILLKLYRKCYFKTVEHSKF